MDHLQAYLDNMDEPLSDDEGEKTRRRHRQDASEVRTQIEDQDTDQEEEKLEQEEITESPSDEQVTQEKVKIFKSTVACLCL